MPGRILIIEDDPSSLDLVANTLEAFGHTVLKAMDGAEGLEIARRENPDLILCDILMPEMSGDEVARQLKGDPVLRKIPLVAMTALAWVGKEEEARAAGFDDYATKPLTPKRIMQVVNTWLPPHLR